MVTTWSESALLTRSASAVAEKPPNTTLWGAPMRAHASIVTGSAGTIGMWIVTTSSSSTPDARSAAAISLTSL